MTRIPVLILFARTWPGIAHIAGTSLIIRVEQQQLYARVESGTIWGICLEVGGWHCIFKHAGVYTLALPCGRQLTCSHVDPGGVGMETWVAYAGVWGPGGTGTPITSWCLVEQTSVQAGVRKSAIMQQQWLGILGYPGRTPCFGRGQHHMCGLCFCVVVAGQLAAPPG